MYVYGYVVWQRDVAENKDVYGARKFDPMTPKSGVYVAKH